MQNVANRVRPAPTAVINTIQDFIAPFGQSDNAPGDKRAKRIAQNYLREQEDGHPGVDMQDSVGQVCAVTDSVDPSIIIRAQLI